MTTERDEAGIYHIDGPPYVGFAVDGQGQRVNVIYKTFRYAGTENECREAFHRLMLLLTGELKKLSGESEPFLYPVVWWRRRVEYNQDTADRNRWRFYCRLATSPDLPKEFWERYVTPEGGDDRNARELCG